MAPKIILTRLLGAALLLPIAIVVLGAIGQLLKSLGDAGGAAVLLRLAQAGGVIWLLSLVGLLLALAARQAAHDARNVDADEEELS